jgi:hypothetical protein
MTVSNLTPPTISGTATQGQTLTAGVGTWSFDLDYLAYAYQWQRCDAAGLNCMDIAGATNSSYVLQAADVGSTIRVEVTATEHASGPVTGTLIFNGDFDTGNLSQYTNVICYTPARLQAVASDAGVTPRQGAYMGRFEARQGESLPWGASISGAFAVKQLPQVGYNQTYNDIYFAWSSWIPSSWPYANPNMHSIFMEWHGNGAMIQAPFHWGILAAGSNAGKFFIDLHRDPSAYSPIFQVAFEALSDPGVANAWHDYTCRIKWSMGGDGKVTFWRDGVLKYDYTGPTAPITGESIKLQTCIYMANAAPAIKVMYHDEVKVGTTYEIVQP